MNHANVIEKANQHPADIKTLNINLKRVLLTLTAAYMVALLGGIWIGSSLYFNHLTLSLLLCLALALFVSLKKAASNVFPVISATLIYFLVYMFPRSLEYIYLPGHIVFPFIKSIDVWLINKGLIYLVVGMVLLLAGIHLAGFLFKNRSKPLLVASNYRKDAFTHVLPLSIAFVLSFLAMIIANSLSGISVIGTREESKYHILVQVSLLLFSIDTSLTCVVATAVAAWRSFKIQHFICVGLVLAAYVLITSYFGSRAGGLRIFFAAIMAFILVHRNESFVLSYKMALTSLAACIFIACLSLFGFKLATAYRNELVVESSQKRALPEAQNIRQQMHDETLKLNSLTYLCSSILNRLGVFDFAILTSALNRSGLPPSIYGTIAYNAKSIANSIPGTPFPEADINTSQVHDIVYSGRKVEEVRLGGYCSRYWTIWGLGTLFTATWWGYSILMIAMGFALQLLYSLIEISSSKYSLYFKTIYLTVFMNIVYFTMGLDHSFITLIGYFTQLLIIIAFLEIAKNFIPLTKKKVIP